MAQSVVAIGGALGSGSDDPVGVYAGTDFNPGDLLIAIVHAESSDPFTWSDNIDPTGIGYLNTGGYGGGSIWQKTMAGGENNISVDWGLGQFINRCITGYVIRSPRYSSIYFADSGAMVWDGTNMVFTSGASTAQNDASVICLAATGSTPVTFSAIKSPPGTAAGGGALEGGVGVQAVEQDNTALLHAGQTLTYRLRPRMDGEAVAGWFINGDRPVASLAGTGRFFGGTGTLTAGEAPDLAGTGRLLIGGGRSRLTAVTPFPQPVRIAEDHLGCGIYQAFAFTRGLGEIVTMLPFSSVQWARILDETSTATLTIDGVANPRAIARCCAALSELEPEEHELAIYRNGWRVWSGPMTDLSFPADQCVIQASDLSWWLTARTIHSNINSVQVDLVNILVAYVQDAMSVENSAGLTPTVLALAGQLGDRLVQQKDHQLAADVIAELSRTGVDWTQLDRRMLLGPLQPQPAPFPGATPYPTLIDANFRVQPTILVSGSQSGNCWYVNGPADGAGDLIFGEYGPEFAATPDHVAQPAAPDYAAIEAQFGRVERVVNESRILDQPGIDFNAQTRYELLRRPLVYISDGALLPSTPIPMDKLLPGSIVNVHLSNVCRVIGEPYRIKQVAVQANADGSESVDVQWQPLGTGETL